MTIFIFVASQTGNSFEAASFLANELRRYHLDSQTIDLTHYTFDELKNIRKSTKTFFVVSTSGQGDLPTPIQNFWKSILNKSLLPNDLADLSFSAFGLGDSAYALTYNHGVRKMRQRLLQLGASEFFPTGYGDDQSDGGYQSDLEKWSDKIIEFLTKEADYGFKTVPALSKNHLFAPEHDIYVLGDKYCGEITQSISLRIDRKILVELKCKRALTEESHFQKVFEYSFSSAENKLLRWEVGDTLCIYPENSIGDVNKLLSLLKIKNNDFINIANKTQKPFREKSINGVFCAEDLFKNYFDIANTPKKSFFRLMLNFSTDPREEERLAEFLSEGGRDDLFRFCARERRTYAEVLESFPNSIPPLQYLIERIPVLKPRAFSISTFCADNQTLSPRNAIQIVVANVEYETFYKRKKVGLCTEYLKNLSLNERILVSFGKGSFKAPRNWTYFPLIAIGPGTGLSALKPMVEQRHFLAKADSQTSKEIALFLGHRNASGDYLYKEAFWDQYRSVLVHFSVAFSRDSPAKHYVTSDIEKYSDVVWGLILKGAFIFVCGSSNKMPTDVKNSILDVIKTRGDMSEQEASQYFAKLVMRQKFQMEIW